MYVTVHEGKKTLISTGYIYCQSREPLPHSSSVKQLTHDSADHDEKEVNFGS